MFFLCIKFYIGFVMYCWYRINYLIGGVWFLNVLVDFLCYFISWICFIFWWRIIIIILLLLRGNVRYRLCWFIDVMIFFLLCLFCVMIVILLFSKELVCLIVKIWFFMGVKEGIVLAGIFLRVFSVVVRFVFVLCFII